LLCDSEPRPAVWSRTSDGVTSYIGKPLCKLKAHLVLNFCTYLELHRIRMKMRSTWCNGSAALGVMGVQPYKP